jgi:hypothetical protein
MSVPFKTNSFRLFSQSLRLDTNRVIEGYNPDLPGVFIKGCAQQLTPTASYDIFGREVDNGMAFYTDPTDLIKSHAEFEGNLYLIERIQRNEQGLATDHIVLFAVRARH